MMKQYLAIKKEYPDALLFYQMGDFYELFFEDAVIGAKAMAISLTSRGHFQEKPIPMAGVPVHTLSGYLAKIVQKNMRAVICEQEGVANLKGLISRKVTRIITPGTLTEAELLNEKKQHLLVAIYPDNNNISWAWLDLASGQFHCTTKKNQHTLSMIERLNPAEILIPESLFDSSLMTQLSDFAQVKTLPNWHFDIKHAYQTLCEHFEVLHLNGLGFGTQDSELPPASALLNYAQQSQMKALTHIHPLKREHAHAWLNMDATTRRNLEITQTLKGHSAPTLFSLLDQCETNMGSRWLRHTLHHPLRDITTIVNRQDAIEQFSKSTLLPQLKEKLTVLADIERIATRIALRTVKPRELAALKNTLNILPEISLLLKQFENPGNILDEIQENLNKHSLAKQFLNEQLEDQPGIQLRDGSIIKYGFSKELDQLRKLVHQHETVLSDFEKQEQKRTGITSLRVAHNQVHGFYIEVSRAKQGELPTEYHRKQTLKNVERFITPELKEFEEKVFSAEGELKELEKELYEKLLTSLSAFVIPLHKNAHAIAELDGLATLSHIAIQNHYIRPIFEQQSHCLTIVNGRHPVVENQIEHFIPNDAHFDHNRKLLLVTGPNMGGKSTYMRQVALIVLLAHCGSFVPATECRLSLFHGIFTRLGASDDLAAGQSTFMIEMSEAANILNNAGQQDLVLMDEIGRGTSTFDGLSLAWAIAKHLATHNQSISLFSTHYFELTQLPEIAPHVANIHLIVATQEEKITFLHQVAEGPASESYGLKVALLAGIPQAAIKEAEHYLSRLHDQSIIHQAKQYPLFFSEKNQSALKSFSVKNDKPENDGMAQFVKKLNPDELTPKQALEILYQIKHLSKKSS